MAEPIIGTFGRLSDLNREERRQRFEEDSNFLSYQLYFFELIAPNEALRVDRGAGVAASTAGDSASVLVPLLLAPESISIVDRFTTARAHTAQGGFYYEESGIHGRTLRIEGTTGFRPRGRPGLSFPGVSVVSDAKTYESRTRLVGTVLSGQKHFQYIQDTIFRAYGDLKRSTTFGPRTHLIFHMPRDNEHWLIIPESLGMRRNRRRRLLYPYEISATIVAPAAQNVLAPEPSDASVFARIAEVTETIKRGISKAQAALEDVNAWANDVERFVAGTISTVNQAAQFISGAQAAVENIGRGVARIGSFSLSSVQAFVDNTESLIQSAVDLPAGIRDTYSQSVQRLGDAISDFGINTDAYREDPRALLIETTNREVGAFGESADTLAAIAADPPTTVQQASRRDGQALPGDARRALDQPEAVTAPPTFQSARRVRIEGADSLQTLSAKFLGDAGRWREIAALNEIVYPYISETGRPGTLRVGDDILVPTDSRIPGTQATKDILGVPLEASPAERLYGRDFALTRVGNDQFDLRVDAAAGSTDFASVAGVDNLVQALNTRLTTERGVCPLYPSLGIRRVIGLAEPGVDRQFVRLRVIEAVRADPRVVDVQDVSVDAGDTLDTVRVQLEAQVVDVDRPVRLTVPTNAATTGTV